MKARRTNGFHAIYDNPVGAWAGEKLGPAQAAFSSRSRCALFPPLRRGGRAGWSRHGQSQRLPMLSPVSVLSHSAREARESFSICQGFRITAPCPPFARGGKGSVARDVVRSRATRTRVSKPPFQYGQHQLFIDPPPLPLRKGEERDHSLATSSHDRLARVTITNLTAQPTLPSVICAAIRSRHAGMQDAAFTACFRAEGPPSDALGSQPQKWLSRAEACPDEGRSRLAC